MRKALCVAVLMVLVWTSVAAGQQGPGLTLRDLAPTPSTDDLAVRASFENFLRHEQKLPEGLESADGHDWVVWTSELKTGYVFGFIAAAASVARYTRTILPPVDLYEALWTDLERHANMTYRVGAYILELDSIYRSSANRDIRLIDALFLANRCLRGEKVDFTEWRKKGTTSS